MIVRVAGSFFLTIQGTLTADRQWAYPDRSDTHAGLGPQTFTGVQTFADKILQTYTGNSAPGNQGVDVTGDHLVLFNAFNHDFRMGVDASAGSWIKSLNSSGATFKVYTSAAGGVAALAYTVTAAQDTVFQNSIGLGAAGITAGNGLLQLTSGTTKANGIAFGTDTFLYRSSAAGLLSTGWFTCGDGTQVQSQILNGTNSGTGGGARWRLQNAGTDIGQIGNLSAFLGTAYDSTLGILSDNALKLYSSNTLAVTIDTSQGVTTVAANYVKTRSVVSAAGTTTLGASDDTAILTGITTQTFTLPAAAAGRRLFVKNRSTAALTVNRAGADTIDGGATLNVAAGSAKILIANGTDWCVWNA